MSLRWSRRSVQPETQVSPQPENRANCPDGLGANLSSETKIRPEISFLKRMGLGLTCLRPQPLVAGFHRGLELVRQAFAITCRCTAQCPNAD